jgi:hypothetical protein
MGHPVNEINIKVKSGGQECPPHTSKAKITIKIKSDGQGCPSHSYFLGRDSGGTRPATR